MTNAPPAAFSPTDAARRLALETVRFRTNERLKLDSEDARTDGHVLDGARSFAALLGHADAATLLERTAEALYGVSFTGDIRAVYRELLIDLESNGETHA